jgi:transposase
MREIQLNRKDRGRLEELITHMHEARPVRRAYALLWLDEGVSMTEGAQRLGVCRQSVYNWVSRFFQPQLRTLKARLTDAPRPGRPCTAKGSIDPLLAPVLDTAPRDLGSGSPVWTAPLLVRSLREQPQVGVSVESVSLASARLRFRWKRPRPQLARRLPTWRQAKGGLNGACSPSRARGV